MSSGTICHASPHARDARRHAGPRPPAPAPRGLGRRAGRCSRPPHPAHAPRRRRRSERQQPAEPCSAGARASSQRRSTACALQCPTTPPEAPQADPSVRRRVTSWHSRCVTWSAKPAARCACRWGGWRGPGACAEHCPTDRGPSSASTSLAAGRLRRRGRPSGCAGPTSGCRRVAPLLARPCTTPGSVQRSTGSRSLPRWTRPHRHRARLSCHPRRCGRVQGGRVRPRALRPAGGEDAMATPLRRPLHRVLTALRQGSVTGAPAFGSAPVSPLL